MTMLIVIASCVLAAVGLLTFAVLDLSFSDDRTVSRRLKGLTAYERGQAKEAHPMLRPASERIVSPLAGWAMKALGRISPADYRQRLATRLVSAGNPNGLDVSRFLIAKMLVGMGLGLGVWVFGVLLAWTFGATLFFGLLAVVAGFLLPDLWLGGVIAGRQHAIVRELPDMLDMLTISVEAGLGFDAAMARVVRVGAGPLAQEFGRALQEVQAGASRKEALRHIADRVDVPELSAFTVAIIQAEMFGISIANVLRTQAAEMRLRRRQRAEEAAQKAPVKMVIPLVLCILPATMIVVGGPAVLRVFGIFS